LRRGRNGQMFLIAVGDRVAKIAWFSQPHSDRGRIDWHTSIFAKLTDKDAKRNTIQKPN
jgi:hypothetical protein